MEVTYLGHESEESLIDEICIENNWDRSKVIRRSMFSTFQYYYNDVVFLKLYEKIIYVRVSQETIPLWAKMGSVPCPNLNAPKDFKPSKPTSLFELASKPSTHSASVKKNDTSYVPRDFWHSVPASLDSITALAEVSLDSYLQNLVIVETRKQVTKIRDLPNISLSFSRMLKGAGIGSLANFKRLGYLQAFQQVKLLYPTAGNDCLLSFYGALNSVHFCAIPTEKKCEIIQEYQDYIVCQDANLSVDKESVCANA